MKFKRIFACLLAVLALFTASVFAAEDGLVRRGSGGSKKIALTFDDGPHPVYTDEILSILESFDVHATFFVIGENVNAHPEIVKRVALASHELGNHTYSHTFLSEMTVPKLCLEVNQTADLLEELTGKRPKLFRPPGGSYSDKKLAALTDMGYTSVLWSKDTRDWERPAVATVVARALTEISGGDIILFHDFNGKYSPTPEALKEIIPELQSRGYELVTVSELLAQE